MFGLFGWLRRRAALRREFPAAWRDILRADVPFYASFDEPARARFEDKLKVFFYTKHFLAAGGFTVDERHKVVIAAAASRLVMYMPGEHYQRLTEIIVYPTHYKHPGSEEGQVIFGEAHHHGTVVLSWDAVVQGLKNTADGHDTATHEFAHVLDVTDGSFDGTPILERAAYAPWARVMSDVFLGLRKRTRKGRGKRPVLREYGAQNEAEFFAVATEAFFEKPLQLHRTHPALYALLAQYYGCDPACVLPSSSQS